MYNVSKVDKLSRIMSENTSVPVSEICELLEVKRPNVYKMLQNSPHLSHLVIHRGVVINRMRQQLLSNLDVPEYVYRVVAKDPTGFIKLGMNWESLDLSIVADALRNEDFTIEALDELTTAHVCSIIRMMMFYLLERNNND